MISAPENVCNSSEKRKKHKFLDFEERNKWNPSLQFQRPLRQYSKAIKVPRLLFEKKSCINSKLNFIYL